MTDDSAAILAAAAACAANGWALYFEPGTYRISRSLTLSVPMVFDGGAVLVPDANVALSIASSVMAGPWQILNLSNAGSSVTGISGPEIRAEWFGTLDPTGTTDNTAAFTAWLKAGKTLPSGLNRVGKYTCNPGHYKITAGLTLDASHQLYCPGVVLDFSSAPAGVVAITLHNGDGQQINADALGGLSLHGPGAGTSSVGLAFSGASNAVVVFNLLKLTLIRAFGVGIKFVQYTWLNSFMGGWIDACGIGVYIANATDSGEAMNWYGTVVSECTIANIRVIGSAADIVFHGGSLDYPANNGSAVQIDAEGLCNLSFHGTHIEQDAGVVILVNQSNANGPTASFFGCMIVLADGAAGTQFIATYISLTILGGVLIQNGSKVQSVLLATKGDQNCRVEFDRIVLGGGITTFLDYAGHTGGIRRIRSGAYEQLASGGTVDSGANVVVPAIASGGTITTSHQGISRVNLNGAPATGVILQAGVLSGQRITVLNVDRTASITFAARVASNVKTGTSCVIPAGTARSFVWSDESSAWYQVT
jgi:hypothetical protein